MAHEYTAGSGDKLSAVRYGQEHSKQEERMAEVAIPVGALVMKSTSNGNDTFVLHDGSADAEVYIAIDARGRGMDLKSDPYPVDDEVKALKPAEETGFNVLMTDGETVTEGDALVVDGGNAGRVAAYASADDSASDIVGFADEDRDLSGGDAEDDHVAFEVEG